jgi:hypothetical protein
MKNEKGKMTKGLHSLFHFSILRVHFSLLIQVMRNIDAGRDASAQRKYE